MLGSRKAVKKKNGLLITVFPRIGKTWVRCTKGFQEMHVETIRGCCLGRHVPTNGLFAQTPSSLQATNRPEVPVFSYRRLRICVLLPLLASGSSKRSRFAVQRHERIQEAGTLLWGFWLLLPLPGEILCSYTDSVTSHRLPTTSSPEGCFLSAPCSAS